MTLRYPECDLTGICHSDARKGATIGNCVHCGAEMFFEGGSWWHHSQKVIHIENRGHRHEPFVFEKAVQP